MHNTVSSYNNWTKRFVRIHVPARRFFFFLLIVLFCRDTTYVEEGDGNEKRNEKNKIYEKKIIKNERFSLDCKKKNSTYKIIGFTLTQGQGYVKFTLFIIFYLKNTKVKTKLLSFPYVIQYWIKKSIHDVRNINVLFCIHLHTYIFCLFEHILAVCSFYEALKGQILWSKQVAHHIWYVYAYFSISHFYRNILVHPKTL